MLHMGTWSPGPNNISPRKAEALQMTPVKPVRADQLFTLQQLEQSPRMLPQLINKVKGSEIDSHFSGVMYCSYAAGLNHEHIVDIRTSDNTDPYTHNLQVSGDTSTNINLPTGDTVLI